jgi:16S rRNA (uracil1498-N3)-methyltransferase
MTRRRWIADEVSGNHAALVGSHAEHLARVLRARVGATFDLVVGDSVRRGQIVSVSKERVEFELGEGVPAPDFPDIGILLAVFKFDRMEWAIEKCTELGVARIVPVIARRTDSHRAAAAAKRVERWERLARQASEQSRRTVQPEIAQPLKVKEAALLMASTRILLAESERKRSLQEALELRSPGENLLLAIGPEGGWTEEELALFIQAGWIAASLGSTILRAETAAIAATAIAVAELS